MDEERWKSFCDDCDWEGPIRVGPYLEAMKEAELDAQCHEIEYKHELRDEDDDDYDDLGFQAEVRQVDEEGNRLEE